MKRKAAVFVIVLAVAVVAVYGCSFYIGEEGESKKVSAMLENKSYILCLEKESIVIYKFEAGERVTVKKGKALPLRNGDADLLEKGMTFNKLEEALEAFEDFVE